MKLKTFVKKCFKSYGFEGRRKEGNYKGNTFYLYYDSFGGQWGFSEKRLSKISELSEVEWWFEQPDSACRFIEIYFRRR